jgi:hypothetical protein
MEQFDGFITSLIAIIRVTSGDGWWWRLLRTDEEASGKY